jgi:hypothetical protein
MKTTFQNAILLVVVTIVHVAVLAQFLPEHSGSSSAGATSPEGMIGPQEATSKAASAESDNPEVELPVMTEAPDLADLVKDAAASFPDSEGSEADAGEPAASENNEVSGAPLVNPEAETVLARMPPEPPAKATEETVVESAKSGSPAPPSEHSDPVAQVRPPSEPTPSAPKSAAADALKVRLISPLP